MKVAKTLDEALQRLKREPGEPVRATVDGMTVEVRVVSDALTSRSAAGIAVALSPSSNRGGISMRGR